MLKLNKPLAAVVVTIALVVTGAGSASAAKKSKPKVRTKITTKATTKPTSATTAASLPAGAAGGITIKDFSFGNGPINAKVGVAVAIANGDGTTHTVTADDGAFDSGNIAGGGSGTVNVAKAGTYAFHCNIHKSMKGSLVVA